MKATAGTEAAIDQAASEWIMRQESTLSPAGERELAEWLAADPRHAAAHARLSRTWAVFDRAGQQGAANTIITRLAVRTRQRRSRAFQATAVAGVFAVAALLLTLQRWPSSGSEVAFEPVRKLPDGSIVELNHGAEISVQYETAIRRVRLLRGEAHFRVQKDSTRPFQVQAGGINVVAVGTAFTVQMAPHAVEVVVTEGRVAVDHTMGDAQRPPTLEIVKGTFVDAGSRVLVNRTAQAALPPQIKPMTETEINERLAWRIPLLEFGGIEMAQAVALMNRTNRLQIILEDASIGKLRVSGVFHSDNPDGFVRIAEAAFELKAERRGENEIVLRRP